MAETSKVWSPEVAGSVWNVATGLHGVLSAGSLTTTPWTAGMCRLSVTSGYSGCPTGAQYTTRRELNTQSSNVRNKH